MWDIVDHLVDDSKMEYNIRVYISYVNRHFNSSYISVHQILEYVKYIHQGITLSFHLLYMKYGQDEFGTYYDIDYEVGSTRTNI